MAVKADIRNNRIYIDSQYSDRELCKILPGSRWSKDLRQWHVPLSWAACKQLRSTFGSRLEIGEDLLHWASNEVKTRIEPCMYLRDALDADPGPNYADLYSFQKAGAEFLYTAQHALLGDDVGSGKTIQVLAAARMRQDSLPALVICPSSVKRNWAREAARWFPECEPFVVEGTAAKRNKILAEAAKHPDALVIINFEAVRLHSRLTGYGDIALTEKERTPGPLNQIPFKLIVVDEAHRLQDPRSKQTRAIWAASHGTEVQYRWALSGTPITGDPSSIWPILHFIEPNEWPAKTKFIDRYCLVNYNLWGGMEVIGLNPNTKDEFFAILDPRFRRMPKEVVLPQLPPIVREVRETEMSAKQRKAYNQMADRLISELESGDFLIARNPMSQVIRMVQYAGSMIEETGDSAHPYRRIDPSNKIDALLEDLGDIHEPVVVFAVSRQLIDLTSARLEKNNIPHAIIKGGQTTDQRQNQIDSFTAGHVAVILVVIAAGGTGINLNTARVGIWMERPFSSVDHHQSIGRIHRIGSEKFDSVVVIDYITPDSIEERIIEILETKKEQLEDVVRDKDAIRKLLGGI